MTTYWFGASWVMWLFKTKSQATLVIDNLYQGRKCATVFYIVWQIWSFWCNHRYLFEGGYWQIALHAGTRMESYLEITSQEKESRRIVSQWNQKGDTWQRPCHGCCAIQALWPKSRPWFPQLLGVLLAAGAWLSLSPVPALCPRELPCQRFHALLQSSPIQWLPR